MTEIIILMYICFHKCQKKREQTNYITILSRVGQQFLRRNQNANNAKVI